MRHWRWSQPGNQRLHGIVLSKHVQIENASQCTVKHTEECIITDFAHPQPKKNLHKQDQSNVGDNIRNPTSSGTLLYYATYLSTDACSPRRSQRPAGQTATHTAKECFHQASALKYKWVLYTVRHLEVLFIIAVQPVQLLPPKIYPRYKGQATRCRTNSLGIQWFIFWGGSFALNDSEIFLTIIFVYDANNIEAAIRCKPTVDKPAQKWPMKPTETKNSHVPFITLEEHSPSWKNKVSTYINVSTCCCSTSAYEMNSMTASERQGSKLSYINWKQVSFIQLVVALVQRVAKSRSFVSL